jgi:hypothetical protein
VVKQRLWTEPEIVSAVALYYQIPFGAIDEKNPAVIELARVIERKPGAVSLKLANLASLDSTVIASGRHGMANASKLDRKVFTESANNWLQLAEELPASVLDAIDRRRYPAERPDSIRERTEIDAARLRETETSGSVKLRRGQDFFRNATLAAYRGRCCVTTLPIRELLRASHIIPWARDTSFRLDPTNGLCLNTLYDAAFDRGLMTLDEELRVVFTPSLRERLTEEVWNGWFRRYEGCTIELPERLAPRAASLLFHRENIFTG